MKKIILLTLFLWVVFGLFAQNEFTISFEAPSGNNFNIFYPLYLNPEESENQPLIFSATLTNTSAQTIPYYLEFEMIWRGNILTPTNGCRIESLNPVGLAPGASITVSNRDIITNGSQLFNVDCQADDILSSNAEFEDLLLQTGRFPDGEYIFTLQAYNMENDQAISEKATVSITVTTPTPISLITPGNPAGMESSVIYDLNPNFVWFSNLNEYTFKLFELNEQTGNTQTQEDIANLAPYYQQEVNTTSFTYPTSAPPLEYGNTYAWQVTAQIVSPLSANEEVSKSDIYTFKISGGEEANPDDLLLINFLRQLNSPSGEEAINLFGNGYSLKSLKFNDADISVNDLNNILLRLANGEIQLKSITIE